MAYRGLGMPARRSVRVDSDPPTGGCEVGRPSAGWGMLLPRGEAEPQLAELGAPVWRPVALQEARISAA
jgi:hypothetical protein